MNGYGEYFWNEGKIYKGNWVDNKMFWNINYKFIRNFKIKK